MDVKYDVLVFGDVCVDLIISGKDVVPQFGQVEKLVDDYCLLMGGSCTIFACQTAKLGLKTAVVGKVGNDSFGDAVLDTLKKSGVSLDYMKRDENVKTGITVALNTGDDRAMLTYNGTIDAVGIEDISDELLESVRHLHIGSYFLMKKIQPHYPQILKKLKEYGATISLDTNWDPEEKWDSDIRDVLKYVDVILPNENEAMALTGESTPEKAIDKLREIVKTVAVKKGKEGASIYTEGRTFDVPSIDVPKVDAVGAGDSFDGGFVYGLLSGMDAKKCAQVGCICGSLNTRAAGGTAGQPCLEEMVGYLEKVL